MVSQEKQIWHCFGCSKGGDIFTFVQEMENMEFPEALRVLAKKAGVELTYQDPSLNNKKTRLLDVLKLAANWYHDFLLTAQDAAVAREYLQQRKVLSEQAESFLLGYAPLEWDRLNNYLINKKYTEEEIFLSGLTVKKEKGIGYYDRFRGRVMFPIRDLHGSIVGFTARLLKEDPDKKVGKYINTPQTMVYDKSQVIYGLDKAKQEIKKQNVTIIVEGNMDVISCQQAGFINVVASSGTAFTERQLNLLKRYSHNIIISFDMDSAGLEAAKRTIELAMQQEMNVKVLSLPVGFKDPDEIIKKDPQLFKQAIEQAVNFMDYFFQITLKNKDIKKVEDKKIVATTILTMIEKIGDPIEQTHYLQKLSTLINVPEEILQEKIRRTGKKIKNLEKKNTKTEEILPEANKKDRFVQISIRLMALILIKLSDFKYFYENLDPLFLAEPRIASLYKKLIEFYNQEAQINIEDFVIKYPEEQKKIDVLLLLAEKDFAQWTNAEIQPEVISIIRSLEKNYIQNRIKILQIAISTAETAQNQDAVNSLMQEFNLLTQKLAQLS